MPRNPKRCWNGEEMNVFCRHYGDCLDQAIEKRWPGWTCAACESRNMKAAPADAVDGYFSLLAAVFGQQPN